MKLRMKIFSGFLILVVMLAVAGIFSIYELMSIRSSVQSLLDDNYESVVAARKMIEALERQDSGLLLWISGEQPEGRSMIENADKAFLSALDTARNNCTIPDEQNVVEDINRQYNAFKALWTGSFENA
ncbi:MAG: MCP four helix bundle domain-containing protein, partial [Acidobacteriota bacterium]